MSRFTPSPGYKLFLARLIQARTDRGLTIEELADRLGLPANLIAAYEAGEKLLDFVQTRTWCLALDVPFTEFVLQVESDLEATLTRDESIVGYEPNEPHQKENDDADGLFMEFDDFDEMEKR